MMAHGRESLDAEACAQAQVGKQENREEWFGGCTSTLFSGSRCFRFSLFTFRQDLFTLRDKGIISPAFTSSFHLTR